MKQASFKFICLIFLACIAVFSGFGQARTVNLESRILESFNGDDDAPYTWKISASRFATEGFPLLTYVEAWPIAAFGGNQGASALPLKSLGIQGRFNRRGYNWVDIYPVLSDVEANSAERQRLADQDRDPDDYPYEIPIPGRVQNFDMWVWGSNLKYYIEIYLRDYLGVVHTLKLGDISYPGWRNLRVNVPNHVPQDKRVLPAYERLKFVKFRIWTQPVERVDNFYIYFKQLKIFTDTFEEFFDGNDLADPDHVRDLWGNN